MHTCIVSYLLTCGTVAQYYIPSYPYYFKCSLTCISVAWYCNIPIHLSMAQPCNILINFCRSNVICILTCLSVAQYCDILLTTSSSLSDTEVSIWTKKVWGLATEETYTSTNSRPEGQEHTLSVCSEGPITKHPSEFEVV